MLLKAQIICLFKDGFFDENNIEIKKEKKLMNICVVHGGILDLKLYLKLKIIKLDWAAQCDAF